MKYRSDQESRPSTTVADVSSRQSSPATGAASLSSATGGSLLTPKACSSNVPWNDNLGVNVLVCLLSGSNSQEQGCILQREDKARSVSVEPRSPGAWLAISGKSLKEESLKCFGSKQAHVHGNQVCPGIAPATSTTALYWALLWKRSFAPWRLLILTTSLGVVVGIARR